LITTHKQVNIVEVLKCNIIRQSETTAKCGKFYLVIGLKLNLLYIYRNQWESFEKFCPLLYIEVRDADIWHVNSVKSLQCHYVVKLSTLQAMHIKGILQNTFSAIV